MNLNTGREDTNENFFEIDHLSCASEVQGTVLFQNKVKIYQADINFFQSFVVQVDKEVDLKVVDNVKIQ